MSLLIAAASARRHPMTPVYLTIPPQLSGWRYLQTLLTDATDYSSPSVDDSAWNSGTAPFGNLTNNPSGADAAYARDHRFSKVIATVTNYDQRLWLRRTFTLAAIPPNGYLLNSYIDNTCDFYLNGVLIVSYTGGPVAIPAANFNVGVNHVSMRCDDDAIGGSGDAVYFDVLLDPAP